jgi:hypothetical protein
VRSHKPFFVLGHRTSMGWHVMGRKAPAYPAHYGLQENDASPLGQNRIRSPSLPQTRSLLRIPSHSSLFSLPFLPLLHSKLPLPKTLSPPEAAGRREATRDSAAWRSSSTSHGYCKTSALGCVPFPAIFLPFLFFYFDHAWLSGY